MNADAAFALERFAWDGPDRLALSGWFSGRAPEPVDAPVLVLHGTDRTRRLAVDGVAGLVADGHHWSATFAWEEPPEAFDAAALELGSGLVVALPDPSPASRAAGDEVLTVQSAAGGEDSIGDRLQLRGDLLAAQEQLAELRAAMERAAEELSRAREDLLDERRRHAADAERYREGLVEVRTAAEEALSEALAETHALRERVRRLERACARISQLKAPVAKARGDTALVLGFLATLERELDGTE
jgi:hypothetical protein